MQRLKILHDKLEFVRWFYDEAVAPFNEIKRKIKVGEDPYPSDVSENDSEPPFVNEWMDADQAINLLGQQCLSILQRSLREFLDDTVRLNPGDKPKEKGNWFANFQEWFLSLGIDWSKAPVSLDMIEELMLARNCIQHGSPKHSYSLIKHQDANYQQRFPNANFINDLEVKLHGGKSVSIQLTKEWLIKTVDQILLFCSYIEEMLPDSMKYQ